MVTPECSGEPLAASSSQNEAPPEWTTRTIAVQAVADTDGPHAISVSAQVRATAGNIGFTARGAARILQQPMAVLPDYAAIAIDVEQIDDHRQPAFEVEAGVDRHWLDEGDAVGRRVQALTQLTAP